LSSHQTLFISDLHLHPSRPSVTENFLRFLEKEAPKAAALYILGDFFEVWAGDDDPNPHHQKVIEALAKFSLCKVPFYFMRGNRDFLIDQDFARAAGCILIPDPTAIVLEGQRILLMHGDSLCTGDRSHQRFRKFSQHPLIRRLFLLLPFSWRHTIASGIRKNSQRAGAKREKISLLATAQKPKNQNESSNPENLNNLNNSKNPENPFDVSQQAVEQALIQYQANILIHGHTHQPAIHEFDLAGVKTKRIVLGEWGALGNVLVYSRDAIELKSI